MVTGREYAEAAKRLSGIRWKRNGRSLQGVDCSGLCIVAGQLVGLQVSDHQGHYDALFPTEDQVVGGLLRAGELVDKPSEGCLFGCRLNGFPHLSHMGVVLADGFVIHMHARRRRAVIERMRDIDGCVEMFVRLNNVDYSS
jgi:cell wall-associated NlpC family hydrolase